MTPCRSASPACFELIRNKMWTTSQHLLFCILPLAFQPSHQPGRQEPSCASQAVIIVSVHREHLNSLVWGAGFPPRSPLVSAPFPTRTLAHLKRSLHKQDLMNTAQIIAWVPLNAGERGILGLCYSFSLGWERENFLGRCLEVKTPLLTSSFPVHYQAAYS